MQTTLSILLSMILLGGLEACSQEILKICTPKIESGNTFDGKMCSCKAYGGWLATPSTSPGSVPDGIQLFVSKRLLCSSVKTKTKIITKNKLIL